jgi:hypothetical protein
VWEGFVDELGSFTLQGPDYEGQSRRLRAADGIHFTKLVRKLAHYVEREINRAAPLRPWRWCRPKEPTNARRAARSRGRSTAWPFRWRQHPFQRGIDRKSRQPRRRYKHPTPRAGKGRPIIPPAGRADDFAWPRRGIAAFGTDPVVTSTTMPVPLAQLPPPPVVTESASKQAARQAGAAAGGSAALGPPRAPARPSFNPFSFFGLFR